MVNADPFPAAGEAPNEEAATSPHDDDFDESEPEADVAGAEEITAEFGIDLADASDLDADNVPADEESGRVVQAPD